MDFSGKIAVVTGGASGIGLASAHEFAQCNAAVAVLDRDARAGQQVVTELCGKGQRADFFPVDVSRGAQVEKCVAEIVGRLGGIDILVNCAGIQRYASATTCSEEAWDEVMNVNLKSMFFTAKYAIPEMVKRGGGSIVNVGSVQSLAAVGNSVHYVTSKHGVLGLTRSLSMDYARQNIRANCVLPGAIDTPLVRNVAAANPDPPGTLAACHRLQLRGTMGKPEEVARVIVFLASSLASLMTGAAVTVDGGLMVPAGGLGFDPGGSPVTR